MSLPVVVATMDTCRESTQPLDGLTIVIPNVLDEEGNVVFDMEVENALTFPCGVEGGDGEAVRGGSGEGGVRERGSAGRGDLHAVAEYLVAGEDRATRVSRPNSPHAGRRPGSGQLLCRRCAGRCR